jgi:putative transposase DNA-binding domain family
MRTVKHKLKPLSLEQKIQFLDLARAYQFEKNYWSDQLLDGSTDEINLKNLYTYQQIRNSKNLTKNNYYSHYNLPVRYCTIALKEAYDLHIRTYESQISFLKRDVNNKIYKFSYTNTGITMSSSTEPNISEDKKESVAAGKAKAMLLNTFKEFLYFTTNSLFYNYKTFRTFEEDFYSKKFRKARIYQRIQPILKKLFGKAMSEAKDVFQLNQVEENNTDQLSLLEENIEILNKFLLSEAKTACSEVECLEELLNYYCNCLVKAVVKFRNFKPIQSQINPTITLDGGCYKLYSKYDETAKKNRWFLDIMSMEVGKRIKGLELTGFHHAKKIMKHKKYPNLTLSFDRTDMTYYAHFTFGTFDTHPSHKARKSLKTRKASKQQRKLNLCQRSQVSDGNGEVKSIQYKLTKDKVNFFYKKHTKNMVNASLLMTMLTVGGDFGVTENYTFSDGWVSGRKQGKILHYISNSTKNSVAGLQRISEKGFFGVEKNNPTGQRNHKNNCFNHNQLLGNINENYRKKQRKYNSFLQNYKYLLTNEIIEHFTTDSVYGQYSNATHENPVRLVFESLDYTSIGFNKKQKRQINLIKGILNVLEEKIKLHALPIEIIYVHPGYTSQNCPNCYLVAKANRNKAESSFRCQHCGFTANDDERYEGLTKVVPEKLLPSVDDFIASLNIAKRPSTVPDSTRLRLRDVKDRLMFLHDSVKVSCKMFNH